MIAPLFATLAVLGLAVPGEPIVVPLWPAAVPGDTGLDAEETSRIYDSPLVGPTRLIRNVTRPSMTVCLPPAGHNTGTAVVICPGGGYWDLYWELEGEEVAAWLNSHGIAGTILKYRCPRRASEPENEPPLGPQIDAQRAMRLVRAHAREWRIDPERIGILGFSAGGHLALATATGSARKLYEPIDKADQLGARPNFAIGCYSGYLKQPGSDAIRTDLVIAPETPPVFLAHTSDDRVSYGGSVAENSVLMYMALKRAGVVAELHVFASGDHDFGVRQNGRLPAAWTDLCLRWLRSLKLLEEPLPPPVAR